MYLGDNVKIFENSKIVGPCYIGDNTVIGNNNIIRQSQIGSGCVTGFNTDITRSYIGDNCWFHSNYIEIVSLKEILVWVQEMFLLISGLTKVIFIRG